MEEKIIISLLPFIVYSYLWSSDVIMTNIMLDRVRKIYKNFPQIPLPQHLGEDDDMQQLSEALGAAKTRVEGCSSFLKAALKWAILHFLSNISHFYIESVHNRRKMSILFLSATVWIMSYIHLYQVRFVLSHWISYL